MIIEIDNTICSDYVYEVTMKVEAKKTESYYQTSFNKNQQESAIKRCLKAVKIEERNVQKITVKALQRLGLSQITKK
jgi:hypothetical protein